MIHASFMEKKIDTNKAELVRRNERAAKNGIYVQTVKYEEEFYKLCPYCLMYQKLDNYTTIKTSGRPHTDCKNCRAKIGTDDYRNKLKANIYAKWQSINRQIIKKKDKCTLDEFDYFFRNEKCVATGKTLLDEFQSPSPNPLMKPIINRIKPVSKGGTAKVDNLQVVPQGFKRLWDISGNHKDLADFLNVFMKSPFYQKGEF